jgi:ATP-dependent DNA helicase RecG
LGFPPVPSPGETGDRESAAGSPAAGAAGTGICGGADTARRPTELMDPTTPAQFLPGVGPVRAKRLAKLGIETVEDLLWHVPRAYMDRSRLSRLDRLVPGAVQTAVAEVVRARLHRRAGRVSVFEIELDDGAGRASAVWFNQPYLYQTIRKGKTLLVHGKVRFYRGLQFQSPEYEILSAEGPAGALHGGRIVPIYALTAGISQKQLRLWVQRGLEQLGPRLADPLPEEMRRRLVLPGLSPAFREVHFPEKAGDAEAARDRLAFEEFLCLQLAFGLVKQTRAEPGTARPLRSSGELVRRFLAGLPFELTAGQQAVLREITADLRRDRPMNRLLQGDVGSGKTVVAAVAALKAIAAGTQVAYMAPTEILAQQQGSTFERWLGPLGRTSRVLLGRMRAAERREILEGLRSGTVDLVVGTHALLEEGVEFARLGLVVVDEQHRFGVMQRRILREKGEWPHCLVMSATPIPRTLSMTLYGDLDLSLLTEMPPGRRPPRTRLVPARKREDLLRFVAGLIRAGQRAFFIYPLVEESEQLDLKDATNMAAALAEHPAFRGIRVGLLHGRLKGEEKEDRIRRFREGSTPCLVATTVVEVGVDIPQATVMVVEHPERFGLSQLHQLRGRVGRGGGTSHFLLLRPPRVSAESLERLRVLVRESDGFRVAEEDLRLRGPGEMLGTAQHGLPTFRVGDLIRDPELLVRARAEAAALLSRDPRLELDEHEGLRSRVESQFGKRMPLYKIG